MDKQNKVLTDITEVKNNYDNILSKFQKERSELKTKLENAEWDAETNIAEYNKMVNDTGINKIVQENKNTSNYAMYGLSLTAVVLLVLVLTKKKSKSN
jgi:predicted DNA-binding ribbon-helix-helix protein